MRLKRRVKTLQLTEIIGKQEDRLRLLTRETHRAQCLYVSGRGLLVCALTAAESCVIPAAKRLMK